MKKTIKTILYLKKDSTLDFEKSNVYNDFKESYVNIVNLIIQKRKEKNLIQKDLAFLSKVERRRIIKFENIDRVDMELLYFLANRFNIKVKFENINSK